MNDVRRQWVWLGVGVLALAALALGLHFGTGVRGRANVRDEALMKVPIDAILQRGWSVETMLDYQELKGPTFFWLYAAGAELLGGDGAINDLRLISIVLFIAGVVPVLLIALRCGVRGPPLIVIAALYALLPYHLILGQLLFSEPSFIFLAAVLLAVFVWGFGADRRDERRVAGPIGFAIVLSLLLHHRPPAVAFAGAACLVAFERDGWRSWPWWLACVVAGLSRLPLYGRWGGVVTSDYQGLFGFGLNPPALSYLLAALLPMTGILLWPVVREQRRLFIIGAACVVGAALGAIAPPDLDASVEAYIPGWEAEHAQHAFAGIVATAVERLTSPGLAERALLALLSGIGAASLAALGVLTWSRSAASCDGIVHRLAFWTFVLGLPLYAITDAPVYDRYLAVWTVLMPLVWWRSLRAAPLLAQFILLVAIAAFMVGRYLL